MEKRRLLVVKRQKGIFERKLERMEKHIKGRKPEESQQHDDDCDGELGHGVSVVPVERSDT